MDKIPYSEKEQTIIGEHIATTSFSWMPELAALFATQPMYNTPISIKKNLSLAWEHKGAMWFPDFSDILSVESRTNLDHVARAEIFDMGSPQPEEEKGGKDLFGIEWVYVPMVGGSMVKPGNPALSNVNDWPEVIHFPDVEKLDWASCKAMNSVLNRSHKYLSITFQNGLFERLISFMDFENAATALIDDDQKDAVHTLFARLCDMYEDMITKYLEVFPTLNAIMFHDDWGSQRAPFFSLATCEEMVAPYLGRLAKFCHDRGLLFQHHCCGKNELLVPAMVDAGVDMWMPQPMNDIDMLYEKYGDKIIFGITPDSPPAEASDEECKAAAKKFVDKYAKTFDEKPLIVFSLFSPNPKMSQYIYKYSRIALCGEE